jgi:hypothetical protein
MTRSAAEAYAPFLTDAQAAEIDRDTTARKLVIDFIRHARDRAEQDRRETWRRVRDGFVAVFVSICGVAMFLALCLVWGK